MDPIVKTRKQAYSKKYQPICYCKSNLGTIEKYYPESIITEN
jgi:hypothetical protein